MWCRVEPDGIQASAVALVPRRGWENSTKARFPRTVQRWPRERARILQSWVITNPPIQSACRRWLIARADINRPAEATDARSAPPTDRAPSSGVCPRLGEQNDLFPGNVDVARCTSSCPPADSQPQKFAPRYEHCRLHHTTTTDSINKCVCII